MVDPLRLVADDVEIDDRQDSCALVRGKPDVIPCIIPSTNTSEVIDSCSLKTPPTEKIELCRTTDVAAFIPTLELDDAVPLAYSRKPSHPPSTNSFAIGYASLTTYAQSMLTPNTVKN